jgi:hypothetical protein
VLVAKLVPGEIQRFAFLPQKASYHIETVEHGPPSLGPAGRQIDGSGVLVHKGKVVAEVSLAARLKLSVSNFTITWLINS